MKTDREKNPAVARMFEVVQLELLLISLKRRNQELLREVDTLVELIVEHRTPKIAALFAIGSTMTTLVTECFMLA